MLRYGVLTPGGRGLVASTLDGLNLAGYGRLHVEGLEGDAWRDFTIRRLTISDDTEPGSTREPSACVGTGRNCCSRRFAVNELDARLMTVLRAPSVKRTAPGGGASVTRGRRRLSARARAAAGLLDPLRALRRGRGLPAAPPGRPGRAPRRRQPDPRRRPAGRDVRPRPRQDHPPRAERPRGAGRRHRRRARPGGRQAVPHRRQRDRHDQPGALPGGEPQRRPRADRRRRAHGRRRAARRTGGSPWRLRAC